MGGYTPHTHLRGTGTCHPREGIRLYKRWQRGRPVVSIIHVYDFLYNGRTVPASQSVFDVSFEVSAAPFMVVTSDLQWLYSSTTVQYFRHPQSDLVRNSKHYEPQASKQPGSGVG